MQREKWILGALAAIILAHNVSVAGAQEAAPQRPKVPLEFPAPQYAQDLTITLATPQAAARAVVKITPLWDGREWAVSSRWDDNHPGNLPMHDCLARHGQSGTFYLNGLYADWGAGTPVLDSKYGRDLLEKGASIGCHSLTHPMLSYCSRNRIFEEILGDRMQWEAAVDRPMISYSFSYCNFTNPQEGPAVHSDIIRLLERSGFYHVANEPTFADVASELVLSPIMPSDGADIDPYAQAALSNAAFKEAHPNLTHSMHAWYDTPAKWARFEAQLDKYGHRADWWYCNQNQYGAYRYQFQRARLHAARPRGNTIPVRLERPLLLDLNDATPLTLEITGAKAEEIVSVKCATADCRASDRKANLFHVDHDRNQALPKKIGMAPVNHSNRHALGANDYDSDFPDLRALLHFEEGRLKFVLENRGVKPLTNVRITYRLPLAWKEGVRRRPPATVPAGGSTTDEFRPTPAQTDLRYTTGRTFFAAQIDFIQGDQPGRLHVGCITPTNNENDPTYPFCGFLVLGPVLQSQLDQDKFAQDVAAGKVGLVDWKLSDGRRAEWRVADGLRQVQQDVEMIPLTTCFLRDPGMLAVVTKVHSPKARKADLLYYNAPTRVFLNRREVTPPAAPGASRAVDLQAGENELLILTVEWGGFYLRLAEPGTQQRLRDIEYRRPDLPAAKGATYTPAPAVPGK